MDSIRQSSFSMTGLSTHAFCSRFASPKDKEQLVLSRRRSRAEKQKGISLTETLFVIAIIALLVALLYPLFTQARQRVNQTVCFNNLKQIGISCFAAAGDNSGFLPGGMNSGGFSNSGDIWVYTLVNYLHGPNYEGNALFAPILKCPSNTTALATTTSYGPVVGDSNFYGACAGGLRDHGAALFRPTKLVSIPNQAKTPYWVEMDNSIYADGIDASGQTYQLESLHFGGSNVLMADGHVQWVVAAEWATSGTTAGPWPYHFCISYPKPGW